MKVEMIKTVFFDLDNTIFDHTRAEQSALKILLGSSPEIFASVDQEKFLQTYHKINLELWKKMAQGGITPQRLKVLRFKLTFEALQIHSANAEQMSQKYLEIYMNQCFTFPNIKQILEYLRPKYELGILSNGFANIQERKLSNLKLAAYFKYFIYSGNVGAMKPYPKIFQEAMRIAQAQPHEIAYVGDSYEDDIKGAKAVGWYAILYDPHNHSNNPDLADFVISDLLELKKIL
jgi:putative hydrolase of the HAD superfamily